MNFQERVYKLIKTIPRGKVSTYKHVAHALECQAYRAVGNALAANPDAPRVPCHRVVRSDRSLGGYGGETSGKKPRRKQQLLRQEGVEFERDGRVKTSCIHEFS